MARAPRLDRHAHGAKFGQRVENDDVVGRIPEHDANKIAKADLDFAQIGHSHVNARKQLSIGDPFVPALDGDVMAPISGM